MTAFAAGIALYFALDFEPSIWTAVFGLALIVCGVGAGRLNSKLVGALWVPLLIVAGLCWSVLHSKSTARPILPAYKKIYTVEGWIEKSNVSGKFSHFYVRVDDIEGLGPDQTPTRVRIRMKPQGLKPGDGLRVRTVLNRPPPPAIVQGYDPGRRAFFDRIGGYGFAIGAPEYVNDLRFSVLEKLKRKLVIVRYSMSAHIQARAPPKTAGLQAALLTGDRSGIPGQQAQSLRDAGLAHLLAISGLHMGLLAGGAYYFASLLLAMIGPWARRYDMRKWAAVIGALFATGYLLLSGAGVSTQRAYIMALIVFAAVIFDRRAVSIRSVAVAAAIVLILRPENLLSAGFQMSFAATAALVAVYRYWVDHKDISDYAERPGLVGKVWVGFKGLSVTSIVAGTATAGFAALHFHRIAKFGLIGNLAAMPVFTLVAMPAGFIAVLLIPIGLDRPFLQIMGWGLEYILAVSDWVSSRDGAVHYIKGANGLIISIYGLGFVLICLGPKIIRLTGAAVIATAVVGWTFIQQPDMRISDLARVAYWDTHEPTVLRVDNDRADGFGRRQLIEKSGLGAATLKSYVDTSAECDKLGCRFVLKGNTVTVISHPEGVPEACSDSDIVVLTQRIAGVVARRKCTSVLIDATDLKSDGALDIHINNDQITVIGAHSAARKARPWGR